MSAAFGGFAYCKDVVVSIITALVSGACNAISCDESPKVLIVEESQQCYHESDVVKLRTKGVAGSGTSPLEGPQCSSHDLDQIRCRDLVVNDQNQCKEFCYE